MKKLIIGALVGGVLLFGWQGLSWMVMGVHDKEYLYTPAQDSLLTAISSSIKEEGQYSLPTLPAGSSQKDREELAKKMEGKPWAVVTYHPAYKMDMSMQMLKGFLVSFLCVLLCCNLIIRQNNQSFMSVFRIAFTFGVVSFLFVWYLAHNFGGTPWTVLQGQLIDDLSGWGITGIWLGWWYSRK